MTNVSAVNIDVYYDQTEDLTCSAVACPAPMTISWTDPNGNSVTGVMTTEQNKLISTVSLSGADDVAGTYRCTAENGDEKVTHDVEVAIKSNQCVCH